MARPMVHIIAKIAVAMGAGQTNVRIPLKPGGPIATMVELNSFG